jgi:hypothetical protein
MVYLILGAYLLIATLFIVAGKKVIDEGVEEEWVIVGYTSYLSWLDLDNIHPREKGITVHESGRPWSIMEYKARYPNNIQGPLGEALWMRGGDDEKLREEIRKTRNQLRALVLFSALLWPLTIVIGLVDMAVERARNK